MSVLLDYVMRVTKTTPIPAPSLLYLQQCLVVVKQKTAETPKTVVKITSNEELAAITDATAPLDLKKGGMSYFYALPTDNLDLNSATITNIEEFPYWTILIDSAFTDEEAGALVLPEDFKGIVSGTSNDDGFIEKQNKKDNFAWFYGLAETNGRNMYKAFGSLLSKPKNKWTNQQYLQMDYNDNIVNNAMADAMFDLRANFVLSDEEFSNRLALFCVGSQGKARAIIAPYVYEEITKVIQGAALTYINLNEPDYNTAEAALLQKYLQGKINKYIDNGTITGGTIAVSVGNEQFIMNGDMIIDEVSALWRLKTNFQEGEI